MSKERDEHLFKRFRLEQIEELVYYLEDEEQEIAGEVINSVRGEKFTQASMNAGALDWIRVFRRRMERSIEARRKEHHDG